jgi:hypothetical protein
MFDVGRAEAGLHSLKSGGVGRVGALWLVDPITLVKSKYLRKAEEYEARDVRLA